MRHKFLIDRSGFHIHDGAFAVGHLPPGAVELQVNGGLRQRHGVVGRVEHQHLAAVGHLVHRVVHTVVVSAENHIEAGHFARHLRRGVLAVVVGHDAALVAAMEKPHYQVGVLVALQKIHPIACALHYRCETQSAPNRLGEPVGNGRCEHTQHSHLHALTVHDGVRHGVGKTGAAVKNVGTERWARHFARPLVVHGVARLHIVVAKRLCIVLHIVDYACRHIFLVGGNVVVIVTQRAALQNVAIVEQHHAIGSRLAQVVHIGTHTSHRPVNCLAANKINGEKTAVHVGGFQKMQLCLVALHRCSHRCYAHRCR